ncbi:DUF4097 family beta strand repeat-containing protein [Phytoactinopolyspora endophytica]|uniref:DUF4097 family beta strand repeat-containing protein n=1 Tax=Phytoactinopolyspora endophytica TaxID=1642495 RepID=UPI00101B922F|nr:DUF4097 family beta strand repeat-containing protein [Phytoactinopolyspora endophytica]
MTFEGNAPDQHVAERNSLGGRSGTSQRIRLISAFAVVVTAVAAYSWLTRSSDEWTTAVENVSRIEVDVAAGEIHLIGTADGSVQLDAHTDDGLVRSARLAHDVDDDTLQIEGTCSGNRFLPSFGCGTHVTLAVPDGVTVVARTDGGSITSTGVVGRADLESAAGGDVIVEGHSGVLRARSTAGDVTATGLNSEEAYLISSAGSVDVEAASPPRSLDAESSAGPVTVGLPTGYSYHVEASGVGGETTVGTDTNYSSAYEVRAFSSAGPVTVTAG